MPYVALAVAAVAMAGATIYSAEQNRKATNEAADRAEAQALRQEKASDEASNKANQKSPDTQAILSAAQQAAKGGVGGTLLTGSTGVDKNQLMLGKNTLLGG